MYRDIIKRCDKIYATRYDAQRRKWRNLKWKAKKDGGNTSAKIKRRPL